MTNSKSNSNWSLFEDLSGNFEIKKHSSFIQMHSEASLIQRKLINGIIYVVKDQLVRQPEAKMFMVDLGILKRLSGVKWTDNSQLKKALKGIMDMSIEYNVLGKDKKQIWGAFSFLSFVQIEVEQRGKASIIKIECPSIVVEAIRQPRMYCQLNLMITRGIESKHALVLYELMMDYIRIRQGLTLKIEDLRSLFWIPEHAYRQGFSMFKERVIDKAVTEINEKTDLHIALDEPERIGRRVVGITFHASKKMEYATENLEDAEVVEKLKGYGFRLSRAMQIVKKHNNEYILANIAAVEEQYTQKGKTIKSVPALLTKAFKTDFRKPETEYSKQQKNKADQKRKEQEHKNEATEQEASLLQAFHARNKKLIEKQYSNLTETEIEEYKRAFKEQLWEIHIASRYIEKEGFEHRVVKATFQKYLQEKLLSPEELDFSVFKKSVNWKMGYLETSSD